MTRLLIITSAVLLIGGCMSPTPHYDQQFGMALESAKRAQTLNPQASRNNDPVAGIDGGAADAAMDEYHDSFRTPPATFPVINIGGGGGR